MNNTKAVKFLKYSSLAISGQPGTGRSTLLNNLKTHLQPLGWEFFSGGEWSRKYAIENGTHKADDLSHHKATDYGDEIDQKIDVAMRNKLADPNAHMAIESWIAGWNMRGFSHVLKILLVCDEALRIDRVVNRDQLAVDAAKKHLEDREKENLTKWSRIHKTNAADFWDPKLYDLVIDTYKFSREETLNKVLEKLGILYHPLDRSANFSLE